jgi:hypothetical protein
MSNRPVVTWPEPRGPGVRLLHCRSCHYSVACKSADLVRFANSKSWLRCCGKAMSFFTPAKPSYHLPMQSRLVRSDVRSKTTAPAF